MSMIINVKLLVPARIRNVNRTRARINSQKARENQRLAGAREGVVQANARQTINKKVRCRVSYTIKPFRATYYNPGKIKNIASVVCPPYDVISPAQLERLQKTSGYNFSHILMSHDGEYMLQGKKFRDWVSDQVMVDDDQECFYLYEQTFRLEKKSYTRYGILSLLRMDREGTVFPHEHTLSKPKEDRKKIIRELKANLSPIFVIIPSKVASLDSLYKSCLKRKPFFAFKDFGGCRNRLWRVCDPKETRMVSSVVQKKRLVIADGHHRFEVSYDYFLNNKEKFRDLNYLVAYVSWQQNGLLILPTHRVVRLKESLNSVFRKLAQYFEVKTASAKNIERLLKKDNSPFSFGIYQNGRYYLLRLKKASTLGKVTSDKFNRKLNTYLLHHFVLPMLDLEQEIEYTHTIVEAKELSGTEKTAFLLKAIPLDTVFTMANKGYRFPQKSTYFYPKLLSGLVVRRFVK